jgi:glutamine synthetase adenylyltransferase
MAKIPPGVSLSDYEAEQVRKTQKKYKALHITNKKNKKKQKKSKKAISKNKKKHVSKSVKIRRDLRSFYRRVFYEVQNQNPDLEKMSAKKFVTYLKGIYLVKVKICFILII